MIDYFESFADWYCRTDAGKLDLDKIEEVFSFDSVPEKRSKGVELFLGRMQPVHLGHLKIIKKMKNPIVALVKGHTTGKDKKRNPLDVHYQTYLLRKMVPGLRIITVNNGYLPEIVSSLRESTGNEVEKVYAGEDRLSDYKRQIDSANKKLDISRQFDIDFVKTERFTSATKVREAIRSGNEEEFKKLTPKTIWDEWGEMKRRLN